MDDMIDFAATGKPATNFKLHQRKEPPKDKFGRCLSCGLKDYHGEECNYWCGKEGE